jgi:leader peptidase (prepilin peptidase)/N-methyltransferase
MPAILTYPLLVLAGLTIGAGLNALADALPAGRPLGRPACAHCGQPHPPRYWVAVAALLFGGRCRQCGTRIGARHALVELAAALALAYTWARWGWSWLFAANAAAVLWLLLITVIDAEHRLILRVVVYPAAVFALAWGLLDADKGASRTLIGGAVGFGVTYLFYIFGRLFARAAGRLRGEALTEVAFGWGDVNFGLFIGLAVGWPGALFALAIAVFAGGVAGAALLLFTRLRGQNAAFMAMPYGPFLALGALTMLLWGPEFAAWYLGR